MRLTRASGVLFGILVSIQLNWSSPSSARIVKRHRLIAMDALAVLPPSGWLDGAQSALGRSVPLCSYFPVQK
jgi:hypothetical protein